MPSEPVCSSGATSRRKRVVTDARREQNRIAQRTYRQKQKENRQRSQKSVKAPKGAPELRPRPVAAAQPCVNQADNVAVQLAESSYLIEAGLDSSEDVLLRDNALAVIPTTAEFPLTPPPDLLPPIDLLPNFSPPDETQLPPSADDAALVLGQHRSSTEPPLQSTLMTLPCPWNNTLRFLQTSIFTACLQNALALGFDLNRLAACANPRTFYMSPFYQPSATPQVEPTRAIDDVPAYLRPSKAQMLVPHHASLDLIPLPRFRDKAILLSAALPHLFNLGELKLDIYARGALTVGMTSNNPWESCFWQAAPWFMKKWDMAIESDQCELVLHTLNVN